MGLLSAFGIGVQGLRECSSLQGLSALKREVRLHEGISPFVFRLCTSYRRVKSYKQLNPPSSAGGRLQKARAITSALMVVLVLSSLGAAPPEVLWGKMATVPRELLVANPGAPRSMPSRTHGTVGHKRDREVSAHATKPTQQSAQIVVGLKNAASCLGESQ